MQSRPPAFGRRLALLVLASLAGCGRKGALYMPEDEDAPPAPPRAPGEPEPPPGPPETESLPDLEDE
jgi:predicted small lipoprotein YifL